MNWDSAQQFIRISLYMVGAFLFGHEIADGPAYENFIGGVLAVGAFIWWLVWERNHIHTKDSE